MKKLLDSPYVGWSAILSGGVQFLGLVFLILFYALEAPQILQSGEPGTPPLFGTLNDASFIFVALFMISPALALHRLLQLKTPTLARVTLMIGLLGLLAGAIVQLLYVPRVIYSVQSSPWLTLSIGIIGVWIAMVSLLGRRGGDLSGGLSWLGMITGVLMSLLPVTYFAGGRLIARQRSFSESEQPARYCRIRDWHVWFCHSFPNLGYLDWEIVSAA